MGRMNFCPRCGDCSLERLKTYSHCGQCLLFIDHAGPNESDLYDGLYELNPERIKREMEREKRVEEFEKSMTERKTNHENTNNGHTTSEDSGNDCEKKSAAALRL